MTLIYRCQICKNDLQENDRVIFSHKETFVFKPASEPDTVNAAKVSPEELRESRKEFTRIAVVNTFCDWGKATLPDDAFYFRHQWCEPVRTGTGGNAHPINKHAVRFSRQMPGRR